MDLLILSLIRMNGIKGEKMEDRRYKFFDIIFCIAVFIMMCHIKVNINSHLTLIFLWVFVLCLIWYTYPNSPKNNMVIIPLWLCVIGYYVIYWDSIFGIFHFFRDVFFG